MKNFIILIAGLFMAQLVHSQPITYTMPALPANGTPLQNGDIIAAGSSRIVNSSVGAATLDGGTLYVLAVDSGYIGNLTFNSGSIVVAGRFETPVLNVTGNYSLYITPSGKVRITDSAFIQNNYDTTANEGELYIRKATFKSTKNWFISQAKTTIDSLNHISAAKIHNKGCMQVGNWFGNNLAFNVVTGTGQYNVGTMTLSDSLTNEPIVMCLTTPAPPNTGTAQITVAAVCSCEPVTPNSLTDIELPSALTTGDGSIYDLSGRIIFKGFINNAKKMELPSGQLFIIRFDKYKAGAVKIINQ